MQQRLRFPLQGTNRYTHQAASRSKGHRPRTIAERFPQGIPAAGHVLMQHLLRATLHYRILMGEAVRMNPVQQ